MRTKVSKAVFILILLLLSGCGMNDSANENITENGIESSEEVSVKIEDNDEASKEAENSVSAHAKTEDTEDIEEDVAAQYPLIATPSDAKRIDLVLVSEGIYCIFDREKYGYITEDGKEITSCIYDIAYPFSEGLACVSKEGKYGYINTEGETAIPYDYDRAAPFMEGLAYLYGFMDKSGTQVFHFECDSVSSFQEGLAYFSKDGRYGYIDQNGQIVIEPVFDDAGYFKDGLADVIKDGRHGVINREGDFVVEAEYDLIYINDWFIDAQINGKYDCFDRTGKVLLEHDQADHIYSSAKGKYLFFMKDEKRGLADENGNILMEPIYDYLSLIPEQNLLIIKKGELYGIVDFQGEVIIPVTYSNINYDSYIDNTEGGMIVLTDTDGNMESMDAADFSKKIPCSYDSIDWLSEDRAIVSLNGFSGIIDREGNTVEPVEYDLIQTFEDGDVWLYKDSKLCIYNSRGDMIEIDDDIDNITQMGNCYQIGRGGRCGILNERGEEVILPVYYVNNDVYGSDNIYILTRYNDDICDTVIRTGESNLNYISGALLQNEITPRIGAFHEFISNGSISVEDSLNGHTVNQEDLRDYRKTYKIYDLNHTGELLMYFEAKPYRKTVFPESYSGFYEINNNQLMELAIGYECGGSARGDHVCLWYDKESSKVSPGVDGFFGGFGGYASTGAVYDRKNGKTACVASFDWIVQPMGNYSDEELLENAELFYDEDDIPYTKERMEQEEGGRAQRYSVNEVQTTMEEYQKIRERYQILHFVE